jgi:hypothetical protein
MAGTKRGLSSALLAAGLFSVVAACAMWAAQAPAAGPQTQPSKVYVPYEHLKNVLEAQKQGIFMPYDDFQRLWRAAQATPAGVEEAPVPYLISTARFKGKVGAELASLQMELTVDVLEDGWVEVPVALGEVAVTKTAFTESPAGDTPLLRVVDGQYKLLVHGKGRRVLQVDFVRQLITQPGLNVLTYAMPPAAITTLELLIPEENMKVDVEPALAATTSQVDMPAGAEPASKPAEGAAASKPAGPKKATQLQAFLGAAQRVKLSWKPRTQAAEELEPVVIADQLQHIDVAEAVISTDVQLNYDIRRRGVDTFTIQLPGDFRIIAVEGANIARWDVAGGEGNQPATRPARAASAPAGGLPVQVVTVKLFAPAKDSYSLNIRMERFLKEAQAKVPLTPVVTHEALRTTGLIAITHAPRRSVAVTGGRNLARVDMARLPEALRARAGAAAYRFISSDYAGVLEIGSVEPRLTVQQLWALGVSADRLDLHGQLAWTIERAGVFEVSMALPAPWEIVSVGPKDIVDDHQVVGKDGNRRLNILLKREVLGTVVLNLVAKADRQAVGTVGAEGAAAGRAEAPVDFVLPVPDGNNVQTYSGQLVLWLAQQFRAEVDRSKQMQPLPLDRAANWVSMPQMAPAMAMEFQAVDRAKPAGAKFKITLKPPQVSAAVYRMVNIQPGWLEQQTVLRYRILNAPVDTFYVQVPVSMADEVRITGADIKEQPRVPRPPDSEGAMPLPVLGEGHAPGPATAPGSRPTAKEVTRGQALGAPAGDARGTQGRDALATQYAYFKIVLQSPVMGTYDLTVSHRRAFQAGGTAASPAPAIVTVEPILAAGKLSDQNGTIAIAKDDTLAIGVPKAENLIPCDPGSETDLPYAPHRQSAVMAFKYNLAPDYKGAAFELSLPVAVQKEAEVFTRLATTAIIEQVIDRNGALNTHATFLLSSSRGDRLAIRLPSGAKVYSVLINSGEAAVEPGANADERILRLPPSSGQVSKLVVEVSYGLEKASAADLRGPELVGDIPVQQTLWRLWAPQEDYLLAYDRTSFGLLTGYEADSLFGGLAAGQPVAPAFKLPAQGVAWNFIRQGPPGKLSVSLIGKEMFDIALWAVILVVGVILLKVGGFARLLIVLLGAVLVAAGSLFAPLLARQIVNGGRGAAIIVGVLWLGQWVFSYRARARKAAAPPPAPVVGGTKASQPSQGKE